MDYFSDIEIIKWGGRAAKNCWTYRYINDYYTLQYIHNGYMHLALDDDNNLKKYNAPFAWLMYKNRYFRYGNKNGAMMGHYYVCFRGPRVEKFIETGLYPMNVEPPVFKINNPDKYLEKFRLLLDSLNATPQKSDRAALLLEDLLLTLHEQKACDIQEKYHAMDVFKLAEKIRQNPEISYDFLKDADKIRVSYSHFRTLFRKYIGMPPGQFVIECRLQKAEMLLCDTEKPLQEIAGECGISDSFYLCRLFKKRYHLSPLKYRKEFR